MCSYFSYIKVINFLIIPIKKSVKYLGVWLNDELLEESRIVRSLSARTKNLFRPNKQISLCSHKSKKLLTNSYGSIYGANAHRYLVKNIFNTEWRCFADFSNGWIEIRSRTLYVVSVGENYRILRNNIILTIVDE